MTFEHDNSSTLSGAMVTKSIDTLPDLTFSTWLLFRLFLWMCLWSPHSKHLLFLSVPPQTTVMHIFCVVFPSWCFLAAAVSDLNRLTGFPTQNLLGGALCLRQWSMKLAQIWKPGITICCNFIQCLLECMCISLASKDLNLPSQKLLALFLCICSSCPEVLTCIPLSCLLGGKHSIHACTIKSASWTGRWVDTKAEKATYIR